jgi:hypothetical protein
MQYVIALQVAGTVKQLAAIRRMARATNVRYEPRPVV